MSLQPNPLTPPSPAPRKRGCFFYGCLTSIIIGIVLIVGIYLGIRYVVSHAVDQYTQTTPAPLPALDSSTGSYLKVKEKVESFQNAIRQGKSSSIQLTGPEINTYLASHPGLEGMTDNFRISIEGSDLKGSVSVPLDQFGYPNRYLNGTLAIQIEMNAGELRVALKGLKVGDTQVPENILNEIGQGNLLDQVDPEKRQKIMEALAGVTAISVHNGVLTMSGGAHQGASA